MNERRHIQRVRTLRSGKIVFNNRSSVIDCTVRNLSGGGALVQVALAVGIPDTFELLIESHIEMQHCTVAWKILKTV